MSDEHPINANDWAKAYPEPRARTPTLTSITPREIEQRLDQGQKHGIDFVIVDVRRTDCTAMIPGAINLPAHSLFLAASTLAVILADVPLLIFHCNRSNGRGPRAAGWFADELQRQTGASDQQIAERVAILHGGIVAWEEHFGAGHLEERGNPRKADEDQQGSRRATVQL